MTWRMPAEWAPHDRVWMAFPSQGYTLGETDAEAEAARRTWANVANAVARFEPVHMLATTDALGIARDLLHDNVVVHEAELDDAWMRDIGPSFVLGEHGELGAVDWVFNGWGAQAWASWDKDAGVGRRVGEQAGATVVDSPIVNEGGGIHVDGEGTVLLTETVQLDPSRNPQASKADIEAEMARCLGASTCIWLPRGLTRDYDEFGTRGHVDIVATFTCPGVVLVHHQENPDHPDHQVSREIIALLENSTDAAGRTLTVERIPAPATLFDDDGPVDYSYVNHLVVNGGVIACTFDDEHDDRALDVLRRVYPGREVVGVDAREIFARGGGIHCITQQQPSVPR
ncbi:MULTISPECIES: agmatine deiminase family protein [unclassified Yimella]|uniref:agmatine deiminase family protein n=1 Tax=unclassified Yimella TaxID=2649892 RepID=UPI00101CA05F|nr:MULTISPECIES: agmatine deiminase family protein [unclassified Yimella]MCG8655694.1 agmatine deiminase family protein [Yimella sp. NH-Cas1]RYG78073.1 agmatine deiminase family protein [Yimella sp. RIT 621]